MNSRLASPLLLSCAALLLTGCPNPNTYGTPRTVAPGKVSHSIAAEWVGWSFKVASPTDSDSDAPPAEVTESGGFIVPPSYALRIGVSDRVDVGFRAANMMSLGADVKYNFLRGETLDLAVDPGAQVLFAGFTVYHLHLPLLVGLNLSERVTVVFTPGIMYGINTYRSGNDDVDSQINQLLSADGLYWRAGLGVNLRVTPGFALHPEITFLRSSRAEPSGASVTSAMSYMFGIGVNFGHLPRYGFAESD